MKSNKVYIHYGHDQFSPDKFCPITNEFLNVKPRGGLWASDTQAQKGWKNWCQSENFRDCNENNAFKFTIAESANIVEIRSGKDLNALPHITTQMRVSWDLLDFERMALDGVDAIELFIDEELYFRLYGWDCDSILIMNKDVVIPIKY